jgi:hypothetical protein
MARHEISLNIPHGITVVNTDIEVVVREDGEVFGRVRISRGSIDWIPRMGRRAKTMGWRRFGDVMEEHGRTRPR